MFWGPWWKTAWLFQNGEHTWWKAMEMGGSVLTSNLRPHFHGNFFYMGSRQNVSGCSFLCPIIPRGSLTLLPPPRCSDVHVILNWCGLKIIIRGWGGEVCSMGWFVNPVHCVAVKRVVTLVQLMRTMGAGGVGGYRGCINLWVTWKKYENYTLTCACNFNFPVQIVLSVCSDLEGQLCAT